MESLESFLRSLKFDPQHPSTVALLTASTLTAAGLSWFIWDYQSWLSMGTGGTPPTLSGYWRMTAIRYALYRSGADMSDWSKIPPTPPSYLNKELPTRSGPRPRIIGRAMPQRQVPLSQIPTEVRKAITALPRKLFQENPEIFRLEPSKTEGGSTIALMAKPNLPGRDARAYNPILGDEIAHVHPSELSLHVWLAEPDAREVVKKGWGLRFPLTEFGKTPEGLIMVYAPTTMEEVAVIEDIVRAGAEYLTGVRI